MSIDQQLIQSLIERVTELETQVKRAAGVERHDYPITDYTPEWTASGTAPVLGNGTLSGRYQMLSPTTCKVYLQLTFGSTTTIGSGVYYFSLPNTATYQEVGTLKGLDGTANVLGVAAVHSSKTKVECTFGSSPTWAAGDSINITLTYEITPTAASVLDSEAPSVPGSLSATAIGDTKVTLGWSASTDNVAVAGYAVYRNGIFIGTAIETSFSDVGLTAGASYSYTVKAYDAAGNYSADSSALIVTTAAPTDDVPPSTPANLVALASSTSQINLSWLPATDNVGVAGYLIYRSGSQVGVSTSPSFSDTGLIASTTYIYSVRAYDAAGNQSELSNTASATTQSVPVSGPTYYVTTDGSATGAGTESSPWSLSKALAGGYPTGKIQPGATVYLRAGTYNAPSGSFILSGVYGTVSERIVFRAYPGERVILTSSSKTTKTLLIHNASYVDLYGLEITHNSIERTADSGEPGAGDGIWAPYEYSQTGVRIIHCIIHDNAGQGAAIWRGAGSCEIYGCVLYFNGQDDGLDHGIYNQNWTGTRLIQNNISFMNGAHGFQAYAGSVDALQNFEIDDNVFFQPTGLYPSPPSVGMAIILGGSARVKNCKVRRNNTYSTLQGTGGNWGAAFRLGYGGGAENTVVTDNFFAGQGWIMEDSYTNVTVTGNTTYRVSDTNEPSSITTTYPSNTWSTSLPTTGSRKVIKVSKYDSRRAHIAIYNWASAASITITNADLIAAGVTIAAGDSYVLRNVQDYFSDTATGVYNSTSGLSVAMTSHTVATPVDLPAPTSTFPIFGAFVLEVTGGSGGSAVTSLIAEITAARDDGYCAPHATRYGYSSTYNYVGYYSSVTEMESAWLRFTLDIPSGTTIGSAYLKLTTVQATASGQIDIVIRAVAEDDAAAPLTVAEYNAFTRTSASVTWHFDAYANATEYTSPNLADVIQEVIDRAGWAANQHIELLLEHSETDTNKLMYAAYSDPASAKLSITYS